MQKHILHPNNWKCKLCCPVGGGVNRPRAHHTAGWCLGSTLRSYLLPIQRPSSLPWKNSLVLQLRGMHLVVLDLRLPPLGPSPFWRRHRAVRHVQPLSGFAHQLQSGGLLRAPPHGGHGGVVAEHRQAAPGLRQRLPAPPLTLRAAGVASPLAVWLLDSLLLFGEVLRGRAWFLWFHRWIPVQSWAPRPG